MSSDDQRMSDIQPAFKEDYAGFVQARQELGEAERRFTASREKLCRHLKRLEAIIEGTDRKDNYEG